MRRPGRLAALVALAVSVAFDRAEAQSIRPSLRLADVLAATDADGFATRAARAQARIAEADRTATLPGLLPQLRVEGGLSRTTDPIGVFGARLRQRAVTAADFDPQRLNNPEALSIATSALVLEQPILAPQALLGRRAASLASEAGRATAERRSQSELLEASRAYFGAVVATASVAALDSAVNAAQAHVAQAESLERNGVVTRSDMLLAQVRLGELEARRATARGTARMARLALALQMGTPGDTSRALPAELPSSAAIRELLTPGWPHADDALTRADVQAARLGAAAARANVTRAKASWLPTVGAMVRRDWASANQPFAASPFWSMGLLVSIPVFSGGGEFADRQRAAAQSSAAHAQAEGAAAMATLEATASRIEREVAVERLSIAERAHEQSREALRLVQRRYDGGLAAISELLDAGAARSSAELAAVAARHDVLVALAAERTAHGLDLTPLFALDR